MRFGSTKDDRNERERKRKAKKRAKYEAKRTKMIWFAWYPVHFEDGNWGFLERVRCTRQVERLYEGKYRVRWWKYHSIDIGNDSKLHDHLRQAQQSE